jgi:catechol 2,3-dioxygenase-like lactoylglutathione lyase family enzyme
MVRRKAGEAMADAGRTEPYGLGDGYGHMAVVVDDLEAAHARFTAEGLAPRRIVTFERDGAVLAQFFFVADPDGKRPVWRSAPRQPGRWWTSGRSPASAG